MMQLRNLIRSLNTTHLFALVCLYALLICLLIPAYETGNDGSTYYGYLQGWMQGRYTYWFDLQDYLPDTFRNPGFPAFVALLGLVSTDPIVVKIVHFLLYCGTVMLVFRILEHYLPDRRVLLIFTALLLFNPIIPAHIVMVSPEVLTAFLLTGWLYIRLFWPASWFRHIVIGLLAGALFQVRPVVLFLPFLLFLLDWFVQRRSFEVAKNSLTLLVFLVSLLPFGYWNYRAHGIFSITSLEGGGGVMHLAYWCPKMPGYYETRYWFNGSPVSLVNFAEPEAVPANIRAFEREWDVIDSLCAPYLTEKDRLNLPYMKAHGERFVTYNGRYTHEREKILKKLAVQHYLEDWPYTLKLKLFTLFRIWTTGLPLSNLDDDDPLSLKIRSVIVPATTWITLLLAVLLIPLAFWRRKLDLRPWLPVLVILVYWGLIHLPFVIQARYTIPVRMLLIALLAASIHGLFFKKEENTKR